MTVDVGEMKSRGRPSKRWLEYVREDMREWGVSYKIAGDAQRTSYSE